MDINLLSPRSRTPTAIRYLIISKEFISNPFFPPTEFNNGFLRIVRLLPKNLVQLNNRTTQWIAAEWSTYTYSGIELQTIYEQNLDFLLAHMDMRQVTVVFIGTDVSDRPDIIRKLDQSRMFYYLHDETDAAPKRFDSAWTLIKLWKEQASEISSHLNKFGLHLTFEFNHEIPIDFLDVNKPHVFIPAMNNFCMLNQYLGNIWHGPDIADVEEDEEAEMAKRTEGAMEKDRILIVNEQIDLIDRFRFALMESEDKPREISNIPRYTPLILVAPFHYPGIEDIYPESFKREAHYDIIRELYKSEQDLAYHGSIDPKKIGEPEDFLNKLKINATLLGEKVAYLDTLAYLHGSFTYSPVLRLPIKGPSLNNFIAIFGPDSPTPSGTKFYRTVQKFGEEYVKTAMHPKLIPQFIKKDRQLICISDLPVEWFSIEGVPLSFTHDVARIPELSYSGIMATYVKNEIVEYSVPENILSSTLIILGVPTDNGRNKEFDIAFDLVEKNSSHFGYHTARVQNLAEAKSAIEKFKPGLLIIDTHGRTREVDKTSELQFGNDWIGGDQIIEQGITAPLVVLSACNTIPNGYFNPISNAFLEAGALAVTGTFLPIGIISGTVLYQRILHNLHTAATKPVHQNWLNFVSHCIRTQYLFEVQNKVLSKVSRLPLSADNKVRLGQKARELTARMLNTSMVFSFRRELFKRLINEYNKLHSGIKLDQSQLSMEQLLYTNIGRPDLIFFESWLKVHKVKLDENQKQVSTLT